MSRKKPLRLSRPLILFVGGITLGMAVWGGWRQAFPCRGISLSAPLAGEPRVLSPFSRSKSHFGTDYAVHGRESILAAADGVVERIGYDYRKLEQKSSRSGLRAQGWGWYVVLRHWNGSNTLYGHLHPTSISRLRRGKLLRKGEAIGRAGNSGAVTGPHLHFEFSPGGEIFDSSSKVDAHLCVVQGS